MRTGWGYVISGVLVDQAGESREFSSAQWSPHDVSPEQLKDSVLHYLRTMYPEVAPEQIMILDFCWSEIGPVKDTGQDMS